MKAEFSPGTENWDGSAGCDAVETVWHFSADLRWKLFLHSSSVSHYFLVFKIGMVSALVRVKE